MRKCFKHSHLFLLTLQPFDLGMIQDFELHSRQYVCVFISKIDKYDTVSDVVKSVNELIAIRWVALAWPQVTANTSQSVSERLVFLTQCLM